MNRAISVTVSLVSGVLIAAHFLRHGHCVIAAVVVLFPLLLFMRKPGATRAVEVMLLLSAVVWVHTLVTLVMERHASGQPWTRMAIILGVVVCLTVWSAITVRRLRLRGQ